jgi:hypothetical protein
MGSTLRARAETGRRRVTLIGKWWAKPVAADGWRTGCHCELYR